MKMSEFTTKSFLGNAGAAENSYILINYEDNDTSRPVTYKASLQEIGKAIANDQKLYKKTQNGAVTTDVSQGAYVNGTAEAFATTGYVDAAVANAGGNDGFTNDGDLPVFVGASDGDLKWYNWADPDNCTPYNVISTNGKYFVTFDASKSKFGYFSDVSAAELTSIPLGGETDLHGYVQAAASLAGQYRLQFVEEGEQGPINVTASMVGAASTGDLSGLASTGYVTNAINTAANSLVSAGYVTSAINTAAMDKVFVSQGKLYYYNSEGSIDAVNTDLISGAAPSTMEYNGTTLSYLLVQGSTDTYFKDDNGAWGNLGAVPVFYKSGTNQLVDIANTPISTARSNTVYYTVDDSNNIWLMDENDQVVLGFAYSEANHTYSIAPPQE